MGLGKYNFGFRIESVEERNKRLEEREKKIGTFAKNSLDSLMAFIRPNEKKELNYPSSFKKSLEKERGKFGELKKSLSSSNDFKLYKTGFVQGYRSGFKENEGIEKKILSTEEYKKYKRGNNLFLGVTFINFLLISSLIGSIFVSGYKSYGKFKNYDRGVNETREFYQENGTCPADSLSQDFVEWQKSWNEKFPNVK